MPVHTPADYGLRLAAWYRAARRDLPWRNTDDAYRIWVSEIMLQQTRVETVRDYYRRFLERFPDVFALADAPEEQVLKLWEGLGYYSRARNMQKAARIVAHECNGVFPNSAKALRALPGIGEYTAGAIASIAYHEPAPAIDGNVKRVASRVFGIRSPMESKASQALAYREIADILTTGEAGELNQALIELGATVCAPRKPRCEACPLQTLCDAYAEGDAETLPVMERKAPPRSIDIAVCLITYGQEVLLTRREARLLHGLYVFCLLEGETEPERVHSHWLDEGLDVDTPKILGVAVHVFTHRIWNMKLFHIAMRKLPDAEWLTAHQAMMADDNALERLPLPTAMKAAKVLAKEILTETGL